YDHCLVLDGGDGVLRRVATLDAARSGRRLEVHTDRPGLQLYSGNFLDGAWRTVEGRPVRQGDAVCLETQALPDAVNQPALDGGEFGEIVLQPGLVQATTTVLTFSASRA
ncbi:MAG: galactose-1-epimerase, partial [Janthinobacterium lividum]